MRNQTYLPEWKWQAWPGIIAENRMTNVQDAIRKVTAPQLGLIDDHVTLNKEKIQPEIDQLA